MATTKRTAHHGTKVVLRYSEIGAWLGGFLGVVVAVIVSAQQRDTWEVSTHLVAFAAAALGGALVGYLAGYIASPGAGLMEPLSESESSDGDDAP
jgi:hypothetical protein